MSFHAFIMNCTIFSIMQVTTWYRFYGYKVSTFSSNTISWRASLHSWRASLNSWRTSLHSWRASLHLFGWTMQNSHGCDSFGWTMQDSHGSDSTLYADYHQQRKWTHYLSPRHRAKHDSSRLYHSSLKQGEIIVRLK